MYNIPQQLSLSQTHLGGTPCSNSGNKFVYIKQDFIHSTNIEPVKVLVNPNFNKKVFVNPNFNGKVGNVVSKAPVPKIHVNPKLQSLTFTNDLSKHKNGNKIHVNPNVLRNVPIYANNDENITKKFEQKCQEKRLNPTIISTRTKLVRVAAKTTPEGKVKKRRSSLRSKYKIIKSSLLEKSLAVDNKMKAKCKLLKPLCFKNSKFVTNQFKLDNRSIKPFGMMSRNKKYVYVNRFLSISDLARNSLLKKNKIRLNSPRESLKKSNYLNRTGNPYKKTNDPKKIHMNGIYKSKYKFLKTVPNASILKNKTLAQIKSSRHKRRIVSKNTSKLRVCNIPCPYYRKFGRCKGKENGKCYRKHDPDQVALCTKFLQGACIDEKCLLSHNVSPEKMPTCKFYLEGSCSRDDCPYLHVRISPKADICRDFLEGYCKKAAECNKRHQFLCPDYEKIGNCLKQRCPYPHGKMVRKYSEFNKNKFAKKSSDNNRGKTKTVESNAVNIDCSKFDNLKPAERIEVTVKSRYYIGQNILDTIEIDQISNCQNDDPAENTEEQPCDSKLCRPKLGKLPSFIALENV